MDGRTQQHWTSEVCWGIDARCNPRTVWFMPESTETCVVSAQALVVWRGNRHSVTPEQTQSQLSVRPWFGEPFFDSTTGSGRS